MFPKKRKPSHPGVILLEDFLKPLGMTSRQFAKTLGAGWSEVKVESIISGKENLSDKVAQEFAAALGTSLEFWKRLQNMYSQSETVHHRNQKGSLKSWKKAQ